MKLPLFIRRRRAESADYRDIRKKWRRDRRERTHEAVRERSQRNSLLFALALGLLWLALYCGWQGVHGMPIDFLGLAITGLGPLVIYLSWAYFVARRRAPVLAYGRYRAEHEALHPPSPWKPFYQLVSEPMGVKIALRLTLSRRYTAAEAEEIGCVFYSDASFELGAPVKEPVRDVRMASDPASGVNDPPIEFVYPDDFQHPHWPLEPGRYHAQWQVQNKDGTTASVGREVRIRKWSLR